MLKLALVFMVILLSVSPVSSEPLCAFRADIINKHSLQLSETPQSLGVNKNGSVVEVLTSPDGATWTIIVTTPDGISCLIASGKVWRNRLRQLTNTGI